MTLLKDLPFSELIALRDYFDYNSPSLENTQAGIQPSEFQKSSIEEREFMDKFIMASFKRIKAASFAEAEKNKKA